MTKQFTKFPSLENTYRQKEIDKIQSMMIKDKWVVTEKVHGANFSFWMTEEHLSVEGIGLCSTVVIKCAKRSGWIEDDEKFFNYQPVLEKYRDSLERLYYHLSGTHACNEVVVFGELYGGNIQSGMCYKDDQDFIAFDMKIDDVSVDKLAMFNDLKTCEIPCVPLLGKFDTLQEALNFNESFDSLLMKEGFSGEEKHKEAEGVVIEPVTPSWFPNGSRVYFKKKTKRFLEKGGNKIHKPVENLPKELEGVLTQAFEYINEPRFNAVVSKIGEVTIKDIGKVMGFMTKDILEDMEKDSLIIPENKKFMKLLQQEVQNFIRPILLQN
mgnify:CR=1 FL=1